MIERMEGCVFTRVQWSRDMDSEICVAEVVGPDSKVLSRSCFRLPFDTASDVVRLWGWDEMHAMRRHAEQAVREIAGTLYAEAGGPS